MFWKLTPHTGANWDLEKLTMTGVTVPNGVGVASGNTLSRFRYVPPSRQFCACCRRLSDLHGKGGLMADFITSCATVSDLTTWYTTTVPASVPSGDRYIAELAAGDYDLSGVTWTGKTLASAGR